MNYKPDSWVFRNLFKIPLIQNIIIYCVGYFPCGFDFTESDINCKINFPVSR